MKKIINVKRVTYIILIIVTLILSTNVYAANDSFKTSLSVNKSQVKRGEKITVTINLSDISIESEEKGIGAYTAILNFDSSVLEYVEDSAKGIGKWETPLYQDSKITGNTNDGKVVNTNQSIGTFEFIVKNNVALGETTIKLVNFSGSTSQIDVSAPDSSVKLTIVDEGSQSGDGSGSEGSGSGNSGSTSQGGSSSQGGTGSGSGSGSTSGNENNQNGQNGGDTNNAGNNTQNNGTANLGNNSATNSSNKENIRDKDLPKTGEESNSLIYIVIAVCVLFAVVCVIRIRLLNKKAKHS